MQTAFGPIAAAYLAAQAWTAKDIGFVLSIGGIASLVCQGPGGELVDTARAKRVLLAIAVVTVALSTLIFRLWPTFPVVALAQALQGITGGVLGPGVVAITLGLVGHAALAERLGQNQRFAAAWLPREASGGPVVAALIIVPQFIVASRLKNMVASPCYSSGLALYRSARCCLF